jgi:hypothetical protein
MLRREKCCAPSGALSTVAPSCDIRAAIVLAVVAMALLG